MAKSLMYIGKLTKKNITYTKVEGDYCIIKSVDFLIEAAHRGAENL